MPRLPAGRLVLAIALIGALLSTTATTGFPIAAGPCFSQDSAFLGVRLHDGVTPALLAAAETAPVPFTSSDKAAVATRPSAGAPSDLAISILGGVFFAPLAGVLHSRSGRAPPLRFSA